MNRFVDFAASAARIMPVSGGVGPFVPIVEMTVCTLCFSKSWVSSSTSWELTARIGTPSFSSRGLFSLELVSSVFMTAFDSLHLPVDSR